MITLLIRQRAPSINVDMLKRCSQDQRWAHKHMIQLLAIHIIHVRVSLGRRGESNIIEVQQFRDRFECLERLDECEFVEITCDDDLGEGVLLEDLSYEGLCSVSSLSKAK